MGKKRLMITIAGILLLSITFMSVAKADDEDLYTVNTNTLNVRSMPSIQSNIIGQLTKGDHVTVFQEKHGWAQTFFDGKMSWLSKQYLTPDKEQTAKASAVQAGKQEKVEKSNYSAKSDKGALEDITIVLDPGHGGEDAGASNTAGKLEKNLTMATADQVAEALREEGATVMMTRTDDNYVSLENRVQISEKHATDAFISLHYDAYSDNDVNGFTTYYNTDGSDKTLASNMQSALDGTMTLNSRGIKQNGYHVLEDNPDLSILVELGFVTSPSDMTAITTEKHEENVAEGIVDGIKQYFSK